MSEICKELLDAQLASLLDDPRSDGAAALRAHVESCETCAAEVMAYLTLRAAVDQDSECPAPASLLAFADSDPTLSEVERAAIGAHVDGCLSCADELAVLTAKTALQRGHASTSATSSGQPPTPLRRIGAVLLHPAFAVAAALLVFVPTIIKFLPEDAPKSPGITQPAQQTEPQQDNNALERLHSLGYSGDGGPARRGAGEHRKSRDRSSFKRSPEPGAQPERAPASPAAVPQEKAKRDKESVGHARIAKLEAARAALKAAPAALEGAPAELKEAPFESFSDRNNEVDAASAIPAVSIDFVAGGSRTLSHEQAVGGLHIRIPASLGALTARIVERGSERGPRSTPPRVFADRREPPSAGLSAVSVSFSLIVPANWLTPGNYTVLVERRGGDPASEEPFTLEVTE